MTIEDGLKSLLSAQPAIVGMIGDRIYPNEAPESSVLPRIVYFLSGNERDHVMSGGDGAPKATLTLECQGSFDQAKDLAEVVRNVLDGYRGYAGEVFVKGCFFEDQTDQPANPVRGEEKAIKVRVVTLDIVYQETVNNLIAG